MTNKKSTKKALFMSAMSLLLCFSMLIGTTFAWFTDSVSSTNNIIKAGNLDVELYWSKNAKDWEKVTKDTNVFEEDTLWEPGHTEVVYLKVVNEGTLALKYQLGVNVDKETVGTNVADQEFKLSDFIMFNVVDNGTAYATRDDAREAAEEGATKLNTPYNGKTTALDPKGGENDEDYVTLVVYMPENVDNAANYKTGTNPPVINLGINLYATQQMQEDDSYGDDYDEDAWHPDMWVSKASELAAAIDAIPDGGIIALSENLTFDKDSATSSGGSWYEGLYYVGDKSFTIDLNGKTITADSAVNDYLMLFKNDGQKANTITFKNGTIEAPANAFCALCTSTTSTQKITINLENVEVSGANGNGSVVKVRGGAELNVKAGTVITGKDSYLGIENGQATVNIYDGAEIYQNGTTSYNGCLVGVGGNGTVNVYGGYGKGVAGGFIAMTSGGTINVYGGEWIANTDGTPVNGNRSVLIAQNDKNTYPSAGNSVVNVTGGTFKGGYNCYGNAVGDAQINISGGNFNADPSSFVEDGSKAVEVDGVYHVVGKNAYFTAADLQAALDAATDGDTIYMAADITGDLTITRKAGVNVTLDGNGHKFTGEITLEGNTDTGSLTIQNINFVAGADKEYVIVAPAKYASGTKNNYVKHVTIDNCTFTDPDNDQVVAAVRAASGGKKYWTIKNCTVDSTMHSFLQVDNIEESLVIENCKVYSKNGANLNSCCNVTMTNCVFDVKGYAVRWGVKNGGNLGEAKNYVIKDSTLKSACDDGDAVIMFRASAVDAVLTLTNTKLEGTTAFKGNTAATTITIDGVAVKAAASQSELNSAVASGNASVTLADGNYSMPGTSGNVTISGTKNTIITVSGTPNGGDLTLNGVTVKGSGYPTGINANTVTYNNATIVGEMCLFRQKVVFNNCTFELNGQYIWTYGAAEVEFNNCTFNTTGKAILIYNEGDGPSKVTVKGCTFNATASAKAGDISNQNCAAIEINNFQNNGMPGTGHVLVTEGNTYSSNFSGEWRIKNYQAGAAVTVNGVEYTKTALDGKLMTVTNKVAAFD